MNRKATAQIFAALVMCADLANHITYHGEPRVYNAFISAADILMWCFILWVGGFWKNEEPKEVTVKIKIDKD